MLWGTKVQLRKSTALEAKVLLGVRTYTLVKMDIGGQSRLDLVKRILAGSLSPGNFEETIKPKQLFHRSRR